MGLRYVGFFFFYWHLPANWQAPRAENIAMNSSMIASTYTVIGYFKKYS